jgi:hypothetical protein
LGELRVDDDEAETEAAVDGEKAFRRDGFDFAFGARDEGGRDGKNPMDSLGSACPTPYPCPRLRLSTNFEVRGFKHVAGVVGVGGGGAGPPGT